MNKTININLGGIFFHIDEIAYQKMKRYLDAVRRSLSDDPQGRDEIIADIELRIGELLSERIKDARQVVSESDIDEIIAIMGQPEDYMVDEELFTDDSGKNYKRKPTHKKLYRDGEDKFLGGVSSGIAHYFDVDVIWIRIAWLFAAFGAGFGFIVYPILWILLPEANTTAEKLQMEGEAVNISNIEKKIRAEFEDVSERVKGAASDVSEAVKEGYDNVSDSLKKKQLRKRENKARSGLQDFIDVIGKIIVTFFMVIGKFIGVLLIIVSVATLIGLIISLFTAGAVDFMGADYLFDSDFQIMNVTGAPIWIISLLTLILVGIPFLMLFVLGLFILSSKSKILSRTAKFVFLGIWIIALLAAIYLGVKQGAEFAREGSTIEKKELVMMPTDTLTIKLVDNETLSDFKHYRHNSRFTKVLDANDIAKFYSNKLWVNIKLSDSTEAYVKVRKEAHGRTRLVARENAEKIEYNFTKSSNTLSFDNYFLTDTKTAFKNQEVKITLYIPENQVIYLDESTRTFLDYKIKTTLDIYMNDMRKHFFKMTNEGLECLDCEDSDFWKTDDDEEGVKLNINENGLEININDNDEKEGVNINIDENGFQMKINDGGEEAEIKIDSSGLRIK
jgi:phage shock protein PspC (stress-responsive transcriptional regulator)